MITTDFSYCNDYLNIIVWVLLFIGLSTSIFYYLKAGKVCSLSPVWVCSCFWLPVLLMGYFPVLRGSADRELYYWGYIQIQQGGIDARGLTDWGYYYFQKLISFLPVRYYLIYSAFIYTLCMYMFCCSISKKYVGILFLGFVLSFTFVSYGINTMRSGIASSFILLALIFRDKKYIWSFFLFIATTIHFSMVIVVIAYLLSRYWNKTRLYLSVWLVSIPVSMIFGSAFEYLLTKISPDERVNYLMVSAIDTHYKVGFRVDFLLYSCLPVLLGYYYIYKKDFQDKFYKNLYNMYLLANTFWILVIRANYSDRFAYLSWFIYSVILLYPLVTRPVVRKQGIWIATILLGMTLFRTFI